MNGNRIKQVMDLGLSSLEMTEREMNGLIEKAEGGKRVKKKLSVATVLLVALIAISVTAFAIISLQQYYEEIIKKEGNYGLIKDWSASDHIDFVEMMAEAGIRVDESKLIQMRDSTLKEEARGKIAWELIQEYYPARDGILTSVDIIAKEKGPVEYWSLEDKAWFSQMIFKYQPEEVGGVNLLPAEEDITKEQASHIR